jgi:hypothetical protein
MFIYTWRSVPERIHADSRLALARSFILIILKALADKKCLSSKTRSCALGSAFFLRTGKKYADCMRHHSFITRTGLVCLTTTGAFATARSNCWAIFYARFPASLIKCGKMSTETSSEDDNFGTEQSDYKSIMADHGHVWPASIQFIFSGYKGEIIAARHFQQFFLALGDVDYV